MSSTCSDVVLSVSGLRHEYRSDRAVQVALADVGFEVGRGEVVVVVGPSGCGKSTLLRIVAGLLRPTAGTIAVDGRPIDGVPDGLGMVFQDYSRSLYPWLRVRANVEFPVRTRLDRPERRRRAEESLAAVGLSAQADKYPWELSGGMQQRVAIARALVGDPELVLMDEPFASVDAQTRSELEDLLLELHGRLGVTVLLVTHDIDESVYLADRIVVLSAAPSEVSATVDVDLARPRDQLATKADPEFLELRARVAGLLKSKRDPAEIQQPAGAPLEGVDDSRPAKVPL